MDAKLLSVIILAVSYVILFSEMLNRAVVAMLGAGVMIISGILTQKSALAGVDFNTIFLLIGMMIIVGIAEKSGIFEYIAVKTVKLVKAEPRLLLTALSLITAVFSALLDNVTTVLLIVPISFQITKKLKVPAYPYLLAEIFASNIGGAATLIGDPPNILIGSALNLSFADFVKVMAPVAAIALAAVIIIFDLWWRRELVADKDCQKAVMALDEKSAIKDSSLVIKSLSVLAATIIGFALAEQLKIENGTIALFGATILLLLYTFDLRHQHREQRIAEAFNLVDWTTIFFFAGLFIIVHGLHETGVLKIMGDKFLQITDGNLPKTAVLTLSIATLLSTAIDNIPFVATMIPMLKSVEQSLGGREIMMPVWWALALGACFGGNGSLIASSANVIAAGIAAKQGEPLNFLRFLLWSLPITLLTVIIAAAYLYLRYFYVWN